MSSVNDLLAAGRLIACHKAPYFRAFYMSLVPIPCPGLGTIGITKDLLLPYDPKWIAKRTQDEMAALYWHEVMHAVLDHHARRGDKHPFLWNVAGDCFINDQGRSTLQLVFPPGGMFPERFGLASNLTTDEYYAALLQQGEDQTREKQKQGQKPGDWKSGDCGSGAGNPIDGEPEGGKGADGEDNGGRSESEIQQTRLRVAEAVKAHAEQHRGRGSLPLGMDRWADAMVKPPKIPWATKLARMTRQAVSYRPGAVDFSYQRISRRQGAVGFGPGRPILPAYVRPVPNVMVWLDTSGSMSQDQLQTGLAETIGVLKAVGADIQFGSCDYAVHAVGKVNNPAGLAKLVKGGGGSSFVPAFEHMAKMRARPEVAIFMTDGDISVPVTCPAGLKVIWLVIDSYRRDSPTTAYGERIVVSNRAGVSDDD
jgi:predicted metal-dependent peptidase